MGGLGIFLGGEWDKMFHGVNEYLKENGELPKSAHTGYGRWISLQRTNYKNGTLSQDKKQKLESIRGWNWGVDYDEIWLNKAQAISEYVTVTGSIPKQSHPELGNWIWTQRTQYKNGELAPFRIKKLESIPGWVWSKNRNNPK